MALCPASGHQRFFFEPDNHVLSGVLIWSGFADAPHIFRVHINLNEKTFFIAVHSCFWQALRCNFYAQK